MKRGIFICFLFLWQVWATAQTVSLTNAETGKLIQLIKKDPSAKAQWKIILKNADEAFLATPNPVDTLLSEGILQGDLRKIRTWHAMEDFNKVYALALAYKVSGEKKYLAKASDFLQAWASKNQPQGNPINDTNLDPIIFAYDLLKNNLSAEIALQSKKWLENTAQQELRAYERALKAKSGITINNWHSHRIKVVALCTWAINNEELKQWVAEKYKAQIATNLRPDGSSYDFYERDALHYHVYNVNPLLVAATILARDKKIIPQPYVYQNETGTSLQRSTEWLIPYFMGEKTHTEFVNSKTAFDKKRAKNGEKGFVAGTLFDTDKAKSTIELAHFFDEKLIILYRQYLKTNAKYPAWQFVINDIKRE